MSSPTIYALASGRPPAAIAIVRISGPGAHPAGARLAGDLPAPREAAVRMLRSPEGEVLDEALVLKFDGPASATGEDVVELHCHGGRAVVDAVLRALEKIHGLREAEPGEFTRRAFENGRIDLTQAEGLADLLEAETESQRRAALGLAGGSLRRQVEQWQARVLELSARAEAAIDYVGEDDLVGCDRDLAKDCLALAEELQQWLNCPRAEALRDGIRVVLAGPPNAGKSSLINAIAGSEKAIVTDVPGTTRDRIEVPLALGGVPFLFVDTAGLRETEDEVERIGVERARASTHEADILWWLGAPGLVPSHPRVLLVHSQMDRPERSEVPSGSMGVSATTGEGLKDLIARTKGEALKLLPAEGAVAINKRQAQELAVACEALRRSAQDDLLLLAEEVRAARSAFDRLTGTAGMEDMLDHLFERFCLGK